MRVAWRRLLNRLRLLALAERGVAAVEFALLLPIMLTIYIGAVEASLAISMDRRVQSITGALGDLVARSDTSINSATLGDYFKAAAALMTPYPADDVRQVVTQVLVSADGRSATVSWSRQHADGKMTVGTKYPEGSSYALPAAMRNIARGKFVIVSEAAFDHEPLYGFVFFQTIELHRENFFMPRFGGSIAIN